MASPPEPLPAAAPEPPPGAGPAAPPAAPAPPTPEGRRTPQGLLGIGGVPVPWRIAALGLLLAGGVGVGWGSHALEVLYQRRVASGGSLAAWQNLFRLGAPWPPLAPVALAAVLLGVGWWHLRHAEPEPSHGLVRRTGREWTAGELRRQLRRERSLVRAGYGAVTAAAGLVAVRFAVYAVLALGGDRVAGGTLLGVALEVVVCVAAWVAATAWITAYLERLEQWGVRG